MYHTMGLGEPGHYKNVLGIGEPSLFTRYEINKFSLTINDEFIRKYKMSQWNEICNLGK